MCVAECDMPDLDAFEEGVNSGNRRGDFFQKHGVVPAVAGRFFRPGGESIGPQYQFFIQFDVEFFQDYAGQLHPGQGDAVAEDHKHDDKKQKSGDNYL